LLCAVWAAGAAEPAADKTADKTVDRVDLGTTVVTGNRELPRVLYVVPWKAATPGDLSGRPSSSLLDEALQPLDRDVFQRQLRYFNALQPRPAAAARTP
jgi:hypothetical protein